MNLWKLFKENNLFLNFEISSNFVNIMSYWIVKAPIPILYENKLIFVFKAAQNKIHILLYSMSKIIWYTTIKLTEIQIIDILY
jgi:hypothetical protein